jgi:hypothetical protein
MKKTSLLLLAAVAFVGAPAAVQAQAYAGPVVAFHDDFDFGVGAYLSVPMPDWHENLGLLFDAEIFFPGDDVSFFTANGGVVMRFPAQSVTPFVLAQLAVRRWSWDYDGPGSGLVDTSSTDIGLNLGGGVSFQGSLRPSVGARLEIGDGSGFVIFGALGFPLGGGN